MEAIKGAFTVRFLRNSDQITLERTITNQSGAGTSLFQYIDEAGAKPDWTQAENQPIITLIAKSAYGYPIKVNSVQWTYGNTTIGEGNELFKVGVNEAGNHYLRIIGNLASKNDEGNKIIGYTAEIVSNGMLQDISGYVDITIQQGGSGTYFVEIVTNRIELDDDNQTTELKLNAYYAGNPVTIDKQTYTVEWLQDGNVIVGATNSTLTVTRSMVEGGSIFMVRLRKDGVIVGADAQRVVDAADEYFIQFTPQEGKNAVSKHSNAVIEMVVARRYKSGDSWMTAVLDTDADYNWTIFNAMGTEVRNGSDNPITLTENDCKLDNNEGANSYGDCEIFAETTVTLA